MNDSFGHLPTEIASLRAALGAEKARADALEATIKSKDRLLPSLLAEGKALEQQRAETAEAKVLVLEADCAAMRKALEAAQWGGGALGMKCPDQRCGNYRPRHQPDCAIGMALATDSGKRLLEEHAAKVAELVRQQCVMVDQRRHEEGAKNNALRDVHNLEEWQVAVAEGLGYLNRAEGQDGYEVAEPAVILRAVAAKDKRIAELEARAERSGEPCDNPTCDGVMPHPQCQHPHRCFKDGRWLDDWSEM